MLFDNFNNRTNYNRRYKSPTFPFSNSSEISASGTLVIDFLEVTPACEKYGYFNNIRVQNSSSSEILIYPNQDSALAISIAPGTTEVIDNEAIPGMSSIKIVNEDSSNAISSNKIRIQVWKTLNTPEAVFQEKHKKTLQENKFSVFSANKKLKGVI